MKSTFTRLLAVPALALLLSFGAPAAQAQQVNPTASSVTEDSLFEALTGNAGVAGRVSIPNAEAGSLINPTNQGWAATHSTTVWTLSVLAVVGMLALLVLFYLIRGRIRVDAGMSGRTILRFGSIDRFAHWLMAGSFIVLALTGLNLVIGRTVVLPLVGEGAFGSITALGKLAHNYVGWAFMLGLILSFLLWVRNNIPEGHDLAWLKQGGGLLKKGSHPAAGKFNAGQKLIFWSVVLGGAALSFTGVMLLFPAIAGTQADWQLYQLIHGLVSAALSAIIIAHIYIGSVGMEGAFDAMGSGEVDENWAKEHHSLWVEEMQGKAQAKPGSKPAAPAAHPAE